MRIPLFSIIALSVFGVGCNVQTGLAPTENVIADCSERDFGFIGTWIPAANPRLPPEADTYVLTIERDKSYTATFRGADGEVHSGFEICFQTAEVADEHPHAIVEIELLREGEMIAHRRLAIAAVKEDQLYLWMIDGRKIGEHLYDDGQTAVVEHFALWSSVRCQPKNLLETIRKHSGDIAGDVQVFRRAPEVGK